MFGSQILDTALGLAFVLMVVSLICSAIREGIESFLKTRATHLVHGIRELLQDRDGTGLSRAVFEHPLIYGLFAGGYKPPESGGSSMPLMITRGGNMPSYIPSRSFAIALMDIAARGPITDDVSGHPDSGVVSLEGVRANVLNIGNPAIQRVVLTAIDTAQNDFEKAVANIQAWYDGSMDRVSGWYKRSTQWILFVIGLALAVGWNVNTLTIADYLFKDTAARAAIVARAETAAAACSAPSSADLSTLNAMNLPIGWDDPRARTGSFPKAFLGWLITAIAASLGAPFWFDVLNRIMVIRSTVKPHEKSPEEASEDRQFGAASSPAGAPVAPAATPAAQAQPAASPPARAVTQQLHDAQSRVDGCDVPIEDRDATPDEDLPAAQGGVA
jgi:hypothetical protein